MESTAEINEITAEATHLKSSAAEAPNHIGNGDEQPPKRPDCGKLDHPAPVVSPLSPEMLIETLAGKGLDFDQGSGSEPGNVVEELTLNNYRGPELFGGEGSMAKKGAWSNLTWLSGDPVLPRRPMQSNPPEPSYSKVNDYLAESENRILLRNVHGKALDGVRKKVLPSSGFPQFAVRNALQEKVVVHALQRKGAASRHQGSYKEPPRMVIQNRNSGIRQASNMESNSISSGRPSERVDSKALVGGGGNVPLSSIRSDGISLREWLTPKHRTLNKFQRLHLFKQVLELVDSSHSQGLVLQNLRPSYFLISPSNLVNYVGSFVPLSRMEQSTSSADQDVNYMEHHSKRKRYFEHGHKEPGISSLKHLKHDEPYNSNRMHGYPVVSSYGRQHAVSKLRKLEEAWYASPEELKECICSFSSNIYSLGVLLFELFCCFETWELHSAAMSDLRYRILPPSFLSKSPEEAGFCLWLLHPEPSSRPSSRDILKADLMSEDKNFSSIDQSSSSIDEEDAEADLLLHFLLNLKEQKEKQAGKLAADVECLKTDIQDVDRRYSGACSLQTNFNYFSDNYPLKLPINMEGASRFSDSNINKERLMRNIGQLEKAYFSLRSKVELPQTTTAERFDTDILKVRDKYSRVQNDDDVCNKSTDPLGSFFEGLCKYARYSKFEVCGSLRSVDIVNPANVICSLSFDRDEDYFATAGVSKKIKIFEFGALLKDCVDIHYPLIEMSSKSKLSCVCWNSYIKNYLASTDYEGVVQLWDASTGQGFTQYTEHRKRAWSIDFSLVDPTKLASGSDDCCVKLWSINEA
ncbi:protein SPA1-RELATED 2-like [Iris pallida]|uniref:Protein SPA1-RELATED 2-like n=2 Tax=Iris pallida TaxID=29817 RepID=A0AAX6GJP0_IRIPA|nr:protein SPA1-RELATED 2-like [Iris pallida]